MVIVKSYDENEKLEVKGNKITLYAIEDTEVVGCDLNFVKTNVVIENLDDTITLLVVGDSFTLVEYGLNVITECVDDDGYIEISYKYNRTYSDTTYTIQKGDRLGALLILKSDLGFTIK